MTELPSITPETAEEWRDMLVQCETKFRRYAAIHEAKVEPLEAAIRELRGHDNPLSNKTIGEIEQEIVSVREKVAANADMADRIAAVLR